MQHGSPTPGIRRPAQGWMAVPVAAAAIIALAGSGAQAQPSPSQPDPAQPGASRPEPSRAAYRNVTRSCMAEVERFCPEVAANPSQPRNWAICLRPYRASLSFGCRRAVRAVIP